MAWQSLALAQTCLFLAAYADPQDLSQVHFFLQISRKFTQIVDNIIINC
jgi:hypothetical protein